MGQLNFTDSGDAEMTATAWNRRAELIDNVFQGNATLKGLVDFGGVEVTGEGGQGIVRPVIVSKNGTADSFSGYDTFSIAPQENETSVIFPWATIWVHVAVAWDEETRNSGTPRLIDIVNMKMDTAMLSLRDEVNIQMVQAQALAGSKDMIGLSELIDVAPSAAPPRGSDVTGGIDQASQTWVRNQALDGAGGFSLAELRSIYNTSSDNVEPPNLLLANKTGYEEYEDSQIDQIRYSSGPSIDAGASDLLFKKTPARWDPQIPDSLGASANTWYGINTRYTKVIFHEKGQFVIQPFQPAMNGAYKVAKILVMMQMICTNRRRNFVYTHDD